jgi:hypothetical protein
MTDLIRAEVLKLRTTRLVYSLLGVTAGLSALGVVSAILSAGRQGAPPLHTTEGARNVFGGGGGTAVLTLVLGILLVTGELRHGTITQTFLVTPRRPRVVGAKLVAMAITGVVFGVVASAVVLAIALPWLAAKEVSPSLGADVVPVLLGSLAATTLFGVIGVGVGALVRNQVLAVVVALVWEFIGEGILVGLVPAVGKWLPQGAGRALSLETLSRGALLPAWAGGLVLVGYAVAFSAAGAALLVRRDVT